MGSRIGPGNHLCDISHTTDRSVAALRCGPGFQTLCCMILYHYPMSPFSEKIRAMLGYAGIAWQSVRVREFPPRPGLDSLTGGYRKIPVAQIGADVFCDTRTITAEITQLANKPELALEGCDAPVRDFVAQTDLEVFLACVLSADGKTLLRKVRSERSLLFVARFLLDRINLGRKADVDAVGPRAARKRVQEHAERLETMLQGDFLFGNQPNIGDFAAYHSLWFIRDLSESPMLEDYSRLNAWMDRMAAFGHGGITDICVDEALSQAKQTEPRPLPADSRNNERVGSEVRIGPADYGRKAVAGELLAETENEWIIGREQWRCGRVHVHFPKQGFRLR